MNADRAERVVLTAEEIADIGFGLSEFIDDAAPLNQRRYELAAEHSVAPRVNAILAAHVAAHVAACDAAWRDRIEAWIRHGEAVPADVTTYERWIVHVELRALAAESQEERREGAPS